MHRVIDFTTLSGAYAARLFAEAGHEVIRVESSEGDEVRRLAPFLRERQDLEHGAFHQFLNAGKKSLTFDFKSAEEQKRLIDLLASADVFLANAPLPCPVSLQQHGLDAFGGALHGLSHDHVVVPAARGHE